MIVRIVPGRRLLSCDATTSRTTRRRIPYQECNVFVDGAAQRGSNRCQYTGCQTADRFGAAESPGRGFAFRRDDVIDGTEFDGGQLVRLVRLGKRVIRRQRTRHGDAKAEAAHKTRTKTRCA